MSEIVVVPHTHWDREWYLPFQRFRMGLVRMLDEVLDTMAAHPAYRFTMDGQLAAVEDYLEIRPERRADLARFVAEGRFAAGPWAILADEFLCSGETLIRNLEHGLRGARELGGAMEVGYLPDQFGHCAQMPQILALAGLPVACLWRGVPMSVESDAFAWKGADGTVIRTQYLPGGYGNAVALFTGPPEGLPDRLAAFTATMRPWRREGPLLAMYGADHSAPSGDITAAGLRLATLGEYLAGATAPDGLPVVEGELRSHARANILPGVISARIPLKQAMGRAERVVTRYAEPLTALWLGGPAGRPAGERSAAGRLIELAWRGLVACSGHDSITGCGADETAQQVAARIAEAEQIGQAVVDLVSSSLARTARRDQLVVVNPSPFPRTALVLADLPERRSGLAALDGSPMPVQRLERAPTLLDESSMDDLTQLLGRVHERELFGHEIVSWTAEEDVFTVVVSRHASTAYRHADLKADVDRAAAARPGPWRVRTVAEPVVTVAARVEVPALGRTTLTSVPAPAPTAAAEPEGDGVLDNGLLRVSVAADGTLSLLTASGLRADGVGRIVDGGDAGDTYNHAPPAADRLVETPAWVKVARVCSGPLVSVLEVARGYRWPTRAAGEGRAGEDAEVTVTTRVELRAGEPFVRLETSFDNACRDHRVRWHARLPRPARESFAGGQYAVVRRGLGAEGGCGEVPLPTFPASGFAAAGGLAVLLDHVAEYEVVRGPGDGGGAEEEGGELAVTLLRAVGHLSRNRNAYRDEPAGPQIATPQAQCPGPVRTRFAVHLHEGGWDEAGLVRLAEEYHHDLLAVPGSAATVEGGGRPSPGATGPEAAGEHGARLEVAGDGVVLGALRERDGWLEVRLVAMRPSPAEAVVRGPFTTARTADTLGRPLASLEVADGAVRLPMRAFEIATLHLR
ncbi:glycoside hydrolase family 38 C-terminal domain-containing protein [Sphaerisporangium fuscum]|uniref:glycoside hydrolase family 38 N-terminal domain-containing protein n=1 Tax=Sphaerisporangium fuscum TaxID=2835868 RepID=UPI0025428256|nr:glycoside hydrolase family 38 C-terminal domain-containing protein [Sphaerisporangium fuscum]